MHARSTTFRGKPEAVDAAVALLRDEVVPAIEQLPGCTGMSLLVDRDTGSCIGTSAWESLDAMRATEMAVAPYRDRVQQLFQSRPEVREWEIAVLHRVQAVPADARARVTWTRVPPAQLDQQLYVFRIGTLPQIEDLPGFCSASLLVDRATGTGALAVVYESAEQLAASRAPASELRTASVEHLGAQVLDVCEFELPIARLRVPERV
ncbi:MAG TPA: antibiotic biosynthesis monooxygenase [Mycobacteriales bacterium]|nr:antibiotic biosynthesis monooxygenase [Mycobacteriales bacterium]